MLGWMDDDKTRSKDRNSELNCTFLLTEGVVDDLEESKVAGCYTVHAKLHDHSLRERQGGREGGGRKSKRKLNSSEMTMISN